MASTWKQMQKVQCYIFFYILMIEFYAPTRAWVWWLMRKEESEKSSCPAIYIWDVNVGEAIHIQFCQCWELTRGGQESWRLLQTPECRTDINIS